MPAELPSATLHILMSLAEDERHGYAIIQDVEARTEMRRRTQLVRLGRERGLKPETT